jgi:hypothetical protein
MKLAGLLVFIGVLAIIYAQVYALWDVLMHQQELSVITRAVWFFALFVFPVLTTVVYLRMGPGIKRWPPWDAED